MDNSFYYGGPVGQPYSYVGLPPTPQQNPVLGGGEFGNDESPPTNFDPFQFDAYGNFHHPLQPPTPQSQHSTHGNGSSNNFARNDSLGDINDPEINDEQKGSNSDGEDEGGPPALSKRKAQNRAAQRAFRERKERHVKDLEAKVAALQAASSTASSENEALKLRMQQLSTENEILKATSQMHMHQQTASNPSLAHTNPRRDTPPSLPDMGPMVYKPQDFYSTALLPHENKTPSHRVVVGEKGRLLATGATWDYILAHPLFKKGLVDVGMVSERLKGKARCDGQGPVFEEGVIEEAIAVSVASGNGELI